MSPALSLLLSLAGCTLLQGESCTGQWHHKVAPRVGKTTGTALRQKEIHLRGGWVQRVLGQSGGTHATWPRRTGHAHAGICKAG